MTERVMVTVAHPDDETIMCGGTIAKHVCAGDEVRVLVAADGVTSRDQSADKDIRNLQLDRAAERLGFTWVSLDFYDQQLDGVPRLKLTKCIEMFARDFEPSIVYTHWHGDMNLDHRIVSECTTVACRPYPGQSVRTLLMGEVCSSTEWAGGFDPDWFVLLNEREWDAKLEALKCYAEELREYPHARSLHAIQSLMWHRAATVGANFAEAFEIGRMIA